MTQYSVDIFLVALHLEIILLRRIPPHSSSHLKWEREREIETKWEASKTIKYATNWKRLFPFSHIIIHSQQALGILASPLSKLGVVQQNLLAPLLSLSKPLHSHLYIASSHTDIKIWWKMGSLIAQGLTLDCSPPPSKPWIPKSMAEFLQEVSRLGSVTEKISKLDDYVDRLQEEMKKIDAFKRELPLCMLLLNDGEFDLRNFP